MIVIDFLDLEDLDEFSIIIAADNFAFYHIPHWIFYALHVWYMSFALLHAYLSFCIMIL